MSNRIATELRTKIERPYKANFVMSDRVLLFMTLDAQLKRNYRSQHDIFRVLGFHRCHQQYDDLWSSVITTNLHDIHSVLCWNITADTWPAWAHFKIEAFRYVTPCVLEVPFCFCLEQENESFWEAWKCLQSLKS